MPRGKAAVAAFLILAGTAWSTALGQRSADGANSIALQREAMTRLAMMDGVWKGPAWTILPSGERRDVVQTQRIGPFLHGSVKVAGVNATDVGGGTGFQASGIVSYDPTRSVFMLHSFTIGYPGDFPLTPNADGYSWEVPMGSAKVRFTAVIKNGRWSEVGDRIVEGKETVRVFEMDLKRVGDANWPAEGCPPN